MNLIMQHKRQKEQKLMAHLTPSRGKCYSFLCRVLVLARRALISTIKSTLYLPVPVDMWRRIAASFTLKCRWSTLSRWHDSMLRHRLDYRWYENFKCMYLITRLDVTNLTNVVTAIRYFHVRYLQIVAIDNFKSCISGDH